MSEFIRALEENDLQTLKKIKKSDFHNHAGLGMSFDRFEKWCGVKLEKPPEKMNGIDGLDKYIGEVTSSYVLSQEGFEFSLEATVKDAILDGVVVLETSIDCCNIRFFQSNCHFLKSITRIKETYKDTIELRPEIGVFKGLNEEAFKKYLTPCIESGIFQSIDFYGTESIYQKKLFIEYFDLAKANGLKTKFHIGEFSSSDAILKVIND